MTKAAPPLRVCLTNPYAWPTVRRGSEAVMHGLASWLLAQGFETRILAGGGDHPASYDVDGVPVRTVRSPDLTWIQRELDPEVTMVPGLAFRLASERPGIVHCFHYCDALAAALGRSPRILSFQGMPVLRAGERRNRRRLLRAGLRCSPVVVCPSLSAAQHLRTFFGSNAEVVPNAIDTRCFDVESARSDSVILCTAAPDDGRKRVEVLVDAFGALRASGRDIELRLAGPATPATQDRLLGRLEEAERHRVTFLGGLSGDALVRAYAEATVTCLPSIYEAFGMVVVESLAAGTPVAGADHSAIPEIIDEDVGVLFAPDDVDAAAHALDELLRRAAGGVMSDSCKRRASRYDWSVVGPQFLDQYSRVL